MTSESWNQILSVIRLELRKTFFARRGLWVYLLAFAPVVLFAGNSVYSTRERARLARMAVEHPVSKEALKGLQIGASPEQVIQALGEPYDRRSIRFGVGPARDRRVLQRDLYRYTDGQTDVGLQFIDG